MHPFRFIPFRSPQDTGWTEAWQIYRTSFPPEEQRSEDDHVRALTDPHFHADGIWTDDGLAGILYFWQYGNTYYIEHLAVNPSMRGQQLGSRALAAFCPGKRVILEIDPPVDDISVRRQHFYRRSGFVSNPHEYIHPSFGYSHPAHRLVLMSYPTPLTDREAVRFARFVGEVVLFYSGHADTKVPELH